MTVVEDRVQTDVPGPAGEPAAEQPARRSGLPVPARGRAFVLIVVVSILALIVIDVLVGRLAHDSRQQQLADIYNDPAATLPERGAPVFALQIESVGLNIVVADRADSTTLRGGPGLAASSSLPGGGGNVVVLGRATRFGGPFGAVRDLSTGTAIHVRTRDGTVFEYEVVDVSTVAGDDHEALASTDEDRLTLATSAGGPFDGRRRVVVAELVGGSEVAADADATTSESIEPRGWDERSVADAGFAAVGMLIVVIGIVAVVDLRRRHSPAAVVAVAVPAIGLGVMLVLFHLDSVLPVTY